MGNGLVQEVVVRLSVTPPRRQGQSRGWLRTCAAGARVLEREAINREEILM